MAQAESKELTVKGDPRTLQFKKILDGDSFQRSLRAALPRHIKPEHMIRVVLGAMQQTPKLMECEPSTVLLSIMRAASMGLEPDGGVLGHGYLIPFWNSKNRRTECQFIPGYRGLCKLARNSGEVADVWAEVVYQADKFEYELGLDQTLTHRRNDDIEDPGPLRYAYAVARFRDGQKKFVVMNRREIEAIKAKSSSKTREGKIVGPWVDHEAEMWKKTAVRRLAKYLPLSPDIASAVMSDDEDDSPTSVVMDALDVVRPDELPPSDTPAIGQDASEQEDTDDASGDDASESSESPSDGPSEEINEDSRKIREEIQGQFDGCVTQDDVNSVFETWKGRLQSADRNWLFESAEKRSGEVAATKKKSKQGNLVEKGSPAHA